MDRQKITRALSWNMLDVLLKNGFGILFLIFLARILTPEDYGAIAVITIFTSIASLFIDGGFSQALIQRRHVTHTDESSIFFFNMLMGLLIALLLCTAAPSIAGFYKLPVLRKITVAMAINLFISAMGTIHIAILTKELDFKTITKVRGVSTILSGLFAVAAALSGWGVWSLVMQSLSASVLSVILLWVWHPWRPAWVISLHSLRSFFGFSGYLILSGLLYTIYDNVYAMIIGRFYSPYEAGFYTQSKKLQAMPVQLMTEVVSRVAFPVFSAFIVEQEKLVHGLRKALAATVFISVPIAVILLLLAEPLILTLFGKQWLPSVPILQVLGVATIIMPLQMLNVCMLKALGRTDLNLRIVTIKFITAIGILLATAPYGTIAIAGGFVLSALINLVINTYYTGSFLNYGVWKQLRDVSPYLVAAIPMIAVIRVFNYGLGVHYSAKLFISAVLGWAVYLLTCKLAQLDPRVEFASLIGGTPLRTMVKKLFFFNRRKVFCIGANKTGTTSVKAVFEGLGLRVGNQARAALFLHDWAKQDYRRIIRYCWWAEAFKDVPFSYPGTFQAVDVAFPGSKFILTVRNNADEWYESLVRFHTKIVGKGRIPTADDLRQFKYLYPGRLWDAARLRYGADESTLYNRDLYTRCYEEHNRMVKEYFKERPADLLVLNVAEPDAMERLMTFLGYPYTGQKMPHINSSKG